MFIKKRRSWELPESAVTPESAALSRRGAIKAAGAAIAFGALAACEDSPPGAQINSATGAAPGVGDPSARLYPFTRNARYVNDRPLTAENIVTGYNNYYEFSFDKNVRAAAQALNTRPWQVSIEGMVEREFKVDIDRLLAAMPKEERIYRHRCVEAWSFIAPWSGFPLKALVDYAKPLSGATYVEMKTFLDRNVAPNQRQIFYPWPYTEGLTMAEAANELAFMVTGAYGRPLEKQNGAPLRLTVPWKYGFKSIKSVNRIIFTDRRPTSYWEAVGPEEYGFWANVNPEVPHPRWSQASEELLGTGLRIPTRLYNGYAEQVASLYTNLQREPLFR